LGPKGVRVNVVSPGYIDTPVAESAGLSPEEIESFFKAVSDRCPAGRVGQPDDIASAVVFLASAESSYIIGAEIVIDGGYTIVNHPV
jgi:NAD(P)-dependent dehydrogenase (short-subunit alcohol dehydrogenase family)